MVWFCPGEMMWLKSWLSLTMTFDNQPACFCHGIRNVNRSWARWKNFFMYKQHKVPLYNHASTFCNHSFFPPKPFRETQEVLLPNLSFDHRELLSSNFSSCPPKFPAPELLLPCQRSESCSLRINCEWNNNKIKVVVERKFILSGGKYWAY